MTVRISPPRMSVEQYLDWSSDQPGRYELFRGRVVDVAPETVLHVVVKDLVKSALAAAIRDTGTDARVFRDGVTVRTGPQTAFEPDVTVQAGRRFAARGREIAAPLVVVEVLSPSTRGVDETRKLAEYFRLDSLHHYLVVDPEDRRVIHHRRGDEAILTRILSEGDRLVLDPPGLTVTIADFFADLDDATDL